MNPYIAEALAALQKKGYSQEQAQAIIDAFLAGNPNDEHRLFAALDLGSTRVTGGDLLAAAQNDAELAQKAYVRNLIPSNLTPTEFFHPTSTPTSAGGFTMGSLVIPMLLLAAAAGAYFYWRR